MLSIVETDFVSNYDCDVFFDPNTIESAIEILKKKNVDLVYPFGENKMDQVRVYSQECSLEEMMSNDYHENPQKFLKLLKKNKIKISPYDTFCGHCQIFKTESYVRGYMENENFISWGPEDKERLWRFRMLGFNVEHMEGNLVYHLEHNRSKDSSSLNPYIKANNFLWEKIQKMSKDELICYYEKQEYLKSY
jgi:GT2 family glycosyltransferase